MNVNPVPQPSSPLTPDQKAAHLLLTELRTRIATQPLPYQHGREDCALKSLYEIFGLTRKAINDNPGCQTFAKLATEVLNTVIRPVTAKWHAASEEGWLSTRDGGDEFRGDLLKVQKKLQDFSLELQQMAYGTGVRDALVEGPMAPRGNPPVDPMAEIEASLLFGIPEQDAEVWKCVGSQMAAASMATTVNLAESADVLARRKKMASAACSTTAPEDATGLAFSGGGIRSATFCLGVAQVLAEKNLLRDVDFLSTVSGGGYTGSFLTQIIGGGGAWTQVASPHGPDTAGIRKLRLNAKFISARSAWQAWDMAVTTLAGMFVNWMVPLAILVLMAAVAVSTNLRQHLPLWPLWVGLGGSVVGGCLYFCALRWRLKWGDLLAAGILALSMLVTGLFFTVEGGLALYDVLFPNAGAQFCSLDKLWASLSSSPLWKAMGVSGVVAGGLSTLVPTVARYFRVLEDPKKRKWVLKGALVVAALFVPVLGLFVFLLLVGLAEVRTIDFFGGEVSGLYLLWVTFGVLTLVTLLALNINQTGPHRLYRDGLSKTFVEVNAAGPGNTPMSKINPADFAPYHLINTTVNLPGSKAEALRERKSDFFLFSKYWSGSPAVGYYNTATWHANSSEMDLATAMAISGAAFSANMGLGSIPPLRALLAFVNVRLGFWIRRPDVGGSGWWAQIASPGFTCLLKEMTALGLEEDRRWLNLSDGGHIENLGVYELLRRRCKFIVCVDGEADPEFTFQGLMTVVRHAQIDLGVRIDPDLDDVRQDAKTTYSRSHYHLCRIHYPDRGPGRPAGTGLLLYIKLSVTGNESELIRRYRGSNPAFPHQSTLDQFFDEEQFEAYRQLGVHAAEGLFQPCLMEEAVPPAGGYQPASMRDWFTKLARNLLE